jgi:cell division protease FtsH
MGGRAAEIVACSRVSTGALDDIQRATDLAYKAVAEYGLSPSVGPMSVGTLSSGGSEDALFGSSVADDVNKQVEVEVKETLTSALWIAVGLVEKNLVCLNEIAHKLSDEEKVQGKWLQTKLDDVICTYDLERFLRGDTPQPPDGAKVWENLPLPAFPGKEAKELPGSAGAR